MQPPNDHDWLAGRFEANRAHLRGVAYRMLGSLSDADDAVQEAWLRLSRSDTSEVENLTGWLTTVVARVSMDMLRSRESRREDSLMHAEPVATSHAGADPEHEAALADSVGLALLVVLDTLDPAERLAFVLHDMFAVPFEEIGPIVGRSPAAARQLASRARRRVRGARPESTADFAQQREVVDAFLRALHNGDFEGLLAVLDPDLVVRTDDTVARAGQAKEVRGARNWAAGAAAFARRARFAERPGEFGQLALVDGAVGVVMAPRGRLFRVLRFAIAHGKVTQLEIIGDRNRLRELEIAVLE